MIAAIEIPDWAAMEHRYGKMLYRRAREWFDEHTAEDVVQNTWFRAWRARKSAKRYGVVLLLRMLWFEIVEELRNQRGRCRTDKQRRTYPKWPPLLPLPEVNTIRETAEDTSFLGKYRITRLRRGELLALVDWKAPDDIVTEREEYEALLARLTCAQKRNALLKMQGFSTAEIADLVGCSRNTVASSMHAARAKVRQAAHVA